MIKHGMETQPDTVRGNRPRILGRACWAIQRITGRRMVETSRRSWSGCQGEVGMTEGGEDAVAGGAHVAAASALGQSAADVEADGLEAGGAGCGGRGDAYQQPG